MPEVVAEITRNLMTVGVKADNIVIHERGGGQILFAHYENFVPSGVRIESGNTWLGYDPDVYVEANFFGEDDTRSDVVTITEPAGDTENLVLVEQLGLFDQPEEVDASGMASTQIKGVRGLPIAVRTGRA